VQSPYSESLGCEIADAAFAAARATLVTPFTLRVVVITTITPSLVLRVEKAPRISILSKLLLFTKVISEYVVSIISLPVHLPSSGL